MKQMTFEEANANRMTGRARQLEEAIAKALSSLEGIEKSLWLGNPDAVTEKVLLLQQDLREVL